MGDPSYVLGKSGSINVQSTVSHLVVNSNPNPGL